MPLPQALQHPALQQLGDARSAAVSDDAADAEERLLAALMGLAPGSALPRKGPGAAMCTALSSSFVQWCAAVNVAPFPLPP